MIANKKKEERKEKSYKGELIEHCESRKISSIMCFIYFLFINP